MVQMVPVSADGSDMVPMVPWWRHKASMVPILQMVPIVQIVPMVLTLEALGKAAPLGHKEARAHAWLAGFAACCARAGRARGACVAGSTGGCSEHPGVSSPGRGVALEARAGRPRRRA